MMPQSGGRASTRYASLVKKKMSPITGRSLNQSQILGSPTMRSWNFWLEAECWIITPASSWESHSQFEMIMLAGRKFLRTLRLLSL